MTARAAILAKLRRRAHASGATGFRYARDSFSEVVAGTPLDRFIALAKGEAMTLDRLANSTEVPRAVRDYLRGEHLPAHIVIDASADVRSDMFAGSQLDVSEPPVKPDRDALLSGCYGAVAESGALVLSTSDGHAIANDFLAETHIVILPAERIFATLADLWDSFRNDAGGGFMPREFCLVTGPSRTADLGVPAKLGAHGPARVHVLLTGV